MLQVTPPCWHVHGGRCMQLLWHWVPVSKRTLPLLLPCHSCQLVPASPSLTWRWFWCAPQSLCNTAMLLNFFLHKVLVPDYAHIHICTSSSSRNICFQKAVHVQVGLTRLQNARRKKLAAILLLPAPTACMSYRMHKQIEQGCQEQHVRIAKLCKRPLHTGVSAVCHFAGYTCFHSISSGQNRTKHALVCSMASGWCDKTSLCAVTNRHQFLQSKQIQAAPQGLQSQMHNLCKSIVGYLLESKPMSPGLLLQVHQHVLL